MRIYNYSSLKSRDTKIYSVGGHSIAGGFSVEFLKVVAPVALGVMVIGFILGLVFGISFFNPFAENFHLWYTLIFIGLGIGAGCALWYIQFAGYRLYQYLGAYVKPKKVYYNGDNKATEYKMTNIKVKSIVKSIL